MPVYTVVNPSTSQWIIDTGFTWRVVFHPDEAAGETRDKWAPKEVRTFLSTSYEVPAAVKGISSGCPLRIIALNGIPALTDDGWRYDDEYKVRDVREVLLSLVHFVDGSHFHSSADAHSARWEALQDLISKQLGPQEQRLAVSAEFLFEGEVWHISDLGVRRDPVAPEIVVVHVGTGIDLALRIDLVEHRPGQDPVSHCQTSVERCNISLLERVKDNPILQTLTGGQIKQVKEVKVSKPLRCGEDEGGCVLDRGHVGDCSFAFDSSG